MGKFGNDALARINKVRASYGHQPPIAHEDLDGPERLASMIEWFDGQLQQAIRNWQDLANINRPEDGKLVKIRKGTSEGGWKKKRDSQP